MKNPLNTVEVIDKLIEIANTYPTEVNRRNANEMCVYQTPNDPDQNCFIGKLARLEGWTVPPYEVVVPADSAATRFGWPLDAQAKVDLEYIQRQADHIDTPWGTLVTMLTYLRHMAEVRMS